MLEVKEVQTLSEQEKTISLFEFIKELNKLKQKVVLNIKDYPWRLAISDIPVFSEYIKVSYRDRVEEDSSADAIFGIIRKKAKQRMIYCFLSANLNLKSVRFQMNFLRTG